MYSRISRFGQIRIYTGKCIRLYFYEKQWKNLLSTAIIMGIICMVTGKDMFISYTDTNNGGFAIICACIWVGLFNSIRSICKERGIIKREHRTGLHISSFVIAHVIFETLQCLAEALIITAFIYVKYYDNMPDHGIIFPVCVELYLTFFLVLVCSDVLGIMISSIVKDENSAMTVMPFVLIIQLVMSGAVFPLEGIAKKVSALTVSRWGLDAVGSIAYLNPSLEDSIRLQEQLTQEVIELDHWDPTASNILFLWGIILLFIAIYILISILFLEGIDRDKR